MLGTVSWTAYFVLFSLMLHVRIHSMFFLTHFFYIYISTCEHRLSGVLTSPPFFNCSPQLSSLTFLFYLLHSTACNLSIPHYSIASTSITPSFSYLTCDPLLRRFWALLLAGCATHLLFISLSRLNAGQLRCLKSLHHPPDGTDSSRWEGGKMPRREKGRRGKILSLGGRDEVERKKKKISSRILCLLFTLFTFLLSFTDLPCFRIQLLLSTSMSLVIAGYTCPFTCIFYWHYKMSPPSQVIWTLAALPNWKEWEKCCFNTFFL